MKKVKETILSGVSIGVIMVGLIAMTIHFINLGPDAEVYQGEEVVASSVCGVGYFAADKATRADFQLLLQRTREACSKEAGVVASHRNEDGSLRHAVVIGGEDAKTPGVPYDTCVVNWELTEVAAEKAFIDVCLERNF